MYDIKTPRLCDHSKINLESSSLNLKAAVKFCHLENTQMLAEAKHKIATIFPSLKK
jgi:ribosomal protein L29